MNPTDLINQAINTLELALAQLQNHTIPVEQPPDPSPGLSDFTRRWLASGGSTTTITTPDVPHEEQSDFRDGSVHTFPGRWSLVANRDCIINFNGGEVPGSPGQSHIALSVNGQEIASWDQPNTLINPPPAATNVRVADGASIVLDITGAPMEVRLSVR